MPLVIISIPYLLTTLLMKDIEDRVGSKLRVLVRAAPLDIQVSITITINSSYNTITTR